jgi:hypothetical protein
LSRRDFNRAAVVAADQVISDVLQDLNRAVGTESALVVAAPAGAGKSFLVETTVANLRPNHRVAVSAPTNEQAFNLTRRISDRLRAQRSKEIVYHLHSERVTPPADATARSNVVCLTRGLPPTAGVIVGTIDKLADSLQRGSIANFGVLVIDEAYQASSSHYMRIAGIAPTHLLVGDPGQIDPFSTLPDGDYWKALPEDPIQTAVSVVLENHPATSVHRLPITRRLAPAAAATASAFYPNHSFVAAVRHGVRRFELPSAGRGKKSVADQVLDIAAASGWSYLELRHAVTLSADPEAIAAAVSVIDRVLDRRPTVTCERFAAHLLRPERIAVAVSHRDQVAHVRTALDRLGHSGLVVDTANRLQGLEFDFLVGIHPMAGLAEPDAFHLDPGRLCVMLTRHRHACVLIGRASDVELLDGIPPATPAYLGTTTDPVLDGWTTHRAVYKTLLANRVAA